MLLVKFLLIVILTNVINARLIIKDKHYWYKENGDLIKKRLDNFKLQPDSLVKVKNVIVFIADGSGINSFSAARSYKREKTGNMDAKLIWDDFAASAIVKTSPENSQSSESSSAATSMFNGVKTNFESGLGLDATAHSEDCSKLLKSKVSSIVSWAQEQNMKTGFVTTARITHATPASLYSAIPNRYWEVDSKVPEKWRLKCKDIAKQLIENEPGKNINVILGGGLRNFLPVNTTSDFLKHKINGKRTDGRNLQLEWQHQKNLLNQNAELVSNRDELMRLSTKTEFLLGLFAYSHMNFDYDREKSEEPSLAEMTAAAIKVLSRNNTMGFFLTVESGRIDHAHHLNNAFRALDDILALDFAIQVALSLKEVDTAETLIVVTSDHSDALVYAGYATPKDFSVFGTDKYVSDIGLKPYPLLTYASGIGYRNHKSNPENYADSIQIAAIAKSFGTHGSADVPLFATGALANFLFSGTVDQNYIPHALAFASCIFYYKERCATQQYPTETSRYRAIHQIRDKLRESSLQQSILEVESNTLRIDPTEVTNYGVLKASSNEIIQNQTNSIYSAEFSPFFNQYVKFVDENSGCMKKPSTTFVVIFLSVLFFN